jgi:YD repeat-containing protein
MQLSPGGHPLLASAVDPRFLGPATHIKYDYNPADTNAIGFIAHEINGVTGEIMVTFSIGNGSRTAAYSNGRVQTYKMPESLAGSFNQYIDGFKTTSFSYDHGGLGFLVQQTDPLGRVTKYTNSRYGNHLHIIYPDTSTNSWTRDSLDLISHTQTVLKNDYLHTRFAASNNSHDYPDTTFETFVYNSFSQVLDHQFRNRGIEHNMYNTRGLKQSFQDAELNLTRYVYDSHDRLSKVIDARGNPTSF